MRTGVKLEKTAYSQILSHFAFQENCDYPSLFPRSLFVVTEAPGRTGTPSLLSRSINVQLVTVWQNISWSLGVDTINIIFLYRYIQCR